MLALICIFSNSSNATETSYIGERLKQETTKSITDDILSDQYPAKAISDAVKNATKKVLDEEDQKEISEKVASDIAAETKSKLEYVKQLMDKNMELRTIKQTLWHKKFHNELDRWAKQSKIANWPVSLPDPASAKIFVNSNINTTSLEQWVKENTPEVADAERLVIKGKIAEYVKSDTPPDDGVEAIKERVTADVASVVGEQWIKQAKSIPSIEDNYYRFYIGRSYVENADGTWGSGTEWSFEARSMWSKNCWPYGNDSRVRAFSRFGKTMSGQLADEANNNQLITASSGRTYIDLGLDLFHLDKRNASPGLRIGAGATNLADNTSTSNTYYKKGFIGLIVPTEYGTEGYADLFVGYAYDNAWKEKTYNPNRIILDGQLSIPGIKIGKSTDALIRLLVNTPTRGSTPTDVSLSFLLRVDINKFIE